MKVRAESLTGKCMNSYTPKIMRAGKETIVINFPGLDKMCGA